MPSRRDLIGLTALGIGMFMAILDVQIVAASLGQIRAGLGATADEVSWVQTSYLIGEALMIPLTGMLTRLMSTRHLFTLSASGFTLASLGCAMAGDLQAMIIWRAIQGFIGGAMVPSLFVAMFRLFPEGRRGGPMAALTVLGTLGPTFGPTLGGYVTEQLSWHWLFLINLLPGSIIAIVGSMAIRWDTPDWKQLRHIDLLGIALLFVTLGAGIYVLEEGVRKDWFADASIRWCAAASVLSAIGLAVRLRTARHPVIIMTPFRDRLFAIGCAYSLLIGISVFGFVFLMVMFLDGVLHFDPVDIGLTMGISGLAQLLLTPVQGWISDRMDPRRLLAISLIFFIAAAGMLIGVSPSWTMGGLAVPLVLRALGITFIFPPVSFIAFARVPPRLLPDASGIFNVLRMLGGAVGIASLNTLLLWRRDHHLALGGMTEQLALAQAFSDAFLTLTVIFILALLLCLPLPRVSGRAEQGAGH